MAASISVTTGSQSRMALARRSLRGPGGKGTATATLSGSKLAISGTFDGLAGPATVARLHEGVAKGARGPVIGDLVVTKGASGTITGSFALTTEQLASLKQGRLYIQLHSEKGVAPDGSNLWGWFLR